MSGTMDGTADRWSTTMEPGITAVFERRAARTRSTPYRLRWAEEMRESLDRFFAREEPGHAARNVRRVAGGASKVMFLFDLVGPDGIELRTYVLRVDPALSSVETCRHGTAYALQASRAFDPLVVCRANN